MKKSIFGYTPESILEKQQGRGSLQIAGQPTSVKLKTANADGTFSLVTFSTLTEAVNHVSRNTITGQLIFNGSTVNYVDGKMKPTLPAIP